NLAPGEVLLELVERYPGPTVRCSVGSHQLGPARPRGPTSPGTAPAAATIHVPLTLLEPAPADTAATTTETRTIEALGATSGRPLALGLLPHVAERLPFVLPQGASVHEVVTVRCALAIVSPSTAR